MHFYQGYAAQLEGKSGTEAHAVGAPLHDPCAVLAVTHPQLFEFARLHVVVETAGTHTRGMTLADRRPWADPAQSNTDVVIRADGRAAVAVILDALRTF
jgi:inosine-uridine nucleoside N-ribohydrolase